MRFQAFRKKQHSDDGQGGPGLDDGRRDPSGEDYSKSRNLPRRRQGQDPGDWRRPHRGAVIRSFRARAS
jgi:hypothetical protein